MVGATLGPYKQRDDAPRTKARDNTKRMAKMELLLRMWVWEGIHHNVAKRSAFVFFNYRCEKRATDVHVHDLQSKSRVAKTRTTME